VILLGSSVAVRLGFLQGLVRPVRITGGSMAENLRGAHFELHCADCGFPCRYDADQPPTGERVVCANCGFVQRDPRDAILYPGQRVLIDRLARLWHRPQRWDAVAFRSPSDPNYLEVKRVVGLPGERISIRRGNVHADGRIVRKTLAQLRRLAILVHDSGFEPPDTSRLPARWRATTWDRLPACHQATTDRLPACQPGTTGRMPIPLADWLVYHHWRCFASPLPRTDEYPVLDDYGYNQDESRQLHRVHDLLLVARLRLEGVRGSVVIRGYDGDDWFQVILEFPAKRASLYRSGHCVSTTSLPAAAYAQDVKLEFAMCDRQAILAVDERVVLCWPYESADDAGDLHLAAAELDPVPSLGNEKDDRALAQSQPFGIAADGLSLVIRRLQVFRDLHYLDPQGLGRDWSAAAPVANDEVLVLGDNVPISRDSRHWQQPGVSIKSILGPVLRIGY